MEALEHLRSIIDDTDFQNAETMPHNLIDIVEGIFRVLHIHHKEIGKNLKKEIITLRERVVQLESIGIIPVEFDHSNSMKIDRGVARDTNCPRCGKRNMIYQPFRSVDGKRGASVAYCFDDYASISF